MAFENIIETIRQNDIKTNADYKNAGERTFAYVEARDTQQLWTDRKKHFYTALVKTFTESQLDQLEAFAKEKVDATTYKRIANDIQSKSPDTKHFAPSMENQMVGEMSPEEYHILFDMSDVETVNKVWEESLKYVPAWLDDTPVHFFAEDIEKFKNNLQEMEIDSAKKDKLLADLDEINNLATGSNKSRGTYLTKLNADYGSALIEQNDREGIKALAGGQFGIIGDYMKYRESSRAFQMHNYQGNTQLKEAMSSVELKFAPEYKEKITHILHRMDELGMVPEGASGAEEGSKVYGFRKLLDAQNALRDAIKKQDAENLASLKTDYVQQLQNMREIYTLVENAITPDNTCVANNVDNMRNNLIPAEFKKSVATNSNVNSLWITLAFIKQRGITIEEFLEHPLKNLHEVISKQMEHALPEKRFEGMTLNDVVCSEAYVDDSDYGVNWLGTMRATDALAAGDKENHVYNVTAGRVLEQLNTVAVPAQQRFISFSNRNYRNTLANMLLVNDEDRDYAHITSETRRSSDGFALYPPFDAMKYAKEHEIDFAAMSERIGSMVQTFTKTVLAQPAPQGKKLSYDVKDMMGGVKKAVIFALLAKNPDLNDNGVKSLTEWLEKPLEALKKYGVTEENIKELFARKWSKADDPVQVIKGRAVKAEKLISDFKKDIADREKSLAESLKAEKKQEKAYNKRAEAILKAATRISEKVAKENNPAKIDKLEIDQVKKMNELKTLQKAEVDRLKGLYEEGKITKYYLRSRTDKIFALEHGKSTAMFAADEGNMRSMEAYFKDSGLDKSAPADAKGIYEPIKEKADAEKEAELNDFVLRKMDILGDDSGLGYSGLYEQDLVQNANLEQVDTTPLETEAIFVKEAVDHNVADKGEPAQEKDPPEAQRNP